MHRAACTYSLPRSTRTSVRTTFAMLIQLVRPMTTDKLHTLACPKMACNKTIRSRFGILMKISFTRVRNPPSFSSAQPLRLPKKTAMSVERSVEQTPMIRESFPPDQIIEKNVTSHGVRAEKMLPGSARNCRRTDPYSPRPFSKMRSREGSQGQSVPERGLT